MNTLLYISIFISIFAIEILHCEPFRCVFVMNMKVASKNKKTKDMPTRLTQEEFVNRANLKHGSKYSYDKTKYINIGSRVIITCPVHGDFEQIAQHHLNGCGCPKCGTKLIWERRDKITTDDFIKKARLVHGDKYEYDKTEYTRSNELVIIKCPTHGYFRQKANSHLSGRGCQCCKSEKIHKLKNKGTEKFVNDAKKIHGDKYIYDKTEYITSKDNVIITCPKHGDFLQSPNSHLRGSGCPKCADERTGERCRIKYDDFIRRAKEIHNNFYIYDKITSSNFDSREKVSITCPIHGDFYQSAKEHLSGRGCYKCGKIRMAEKQSMTRDEVVNRLNIIHENKYDYSLFTEYNGKDDYISVICPKHGVWKVSIDNHLYRHSGCPRCRRSFGEERVANFLKKHHIEYKEQWRIKNEYLFCNNSIMMVDFYLPSHRIIIEYNGIQHYEQSPVFDTRTFEQQQERDNAVRDYCKAHKIKLVEIPYTKYDEIENILQKELHL